MNHRPYTHFGMTLAELLIGVAIIGVLVSLALSGAQSQWQRERIVSTAQELVGWMESTRRISLRGASCIADITDGSVALGGKVAGVSTSSSNCSSVPSLFLTSVSKGYTLSISTTGFNEANKASQKTTSITFTPRGTIDTTSGSPNKVITLTLQPSGISRCITINNLAASMQIGKIVNGNCNTSSGY